MYTDKYCLKSKYIMFENFCKNLFYNIAVKIINLIYKNVKDYINCELNV